MAELIGKKIGAYEVTGKIGEGGMAEVYRAVQSSIGREVAIKILPTNFNQDEQFGERFAREVKVIAELQHPRILPVYDYGEWEGRPYIVMAYLGGGSLEDLILQSKEGMDLNKVVRLVNQIAEALDHAHEKGIIHRDFKPANVLLDDKGNIHLADFGIAKVTQSTAQLTGTSLIGTPAYMAPEMADDSIVTKLIDIYALGVTLYHMVTGDVPFDATNPMGVLMAHLSYPIPDARVKRQDISDDVQYVIERAMAKDPEQRYQSGQELAADLAEAVKGGLGITLDAPGDVERTRPTVSEFLRDKSRQTARLTRPDMSGILPDPNPPRRGSWLWVVGGIVVIAVIVGVLMATRGGTPSAVAPPQDEATPTEAQTEVVEPTATRAPTDTPAPTATPTDEPTITPTAEPTLFGGGTGSIVFLSFRDGDGELYLMDVNSRRVTKLTDNVYNESQPAWSPDGTMLAYVSAQAGNQDIYVMDMTVDPEDRVPIQITTNINDDISPAWSPDGQRLLFVSNRERNYDVFVVRLDGSGLFKLTDDPADDFSPTWSPDGMHIAFESFRDGDSEIYVMDPDGSNIEQLTDNSVQDETPMYSPDGERILFASNRDGDFEIYTIGTDIPDIEQLTDNPYPDLQPSWSADGTWVVFVSERDGNREIYFMQRDGRRQNRLTEDLASEGNPVWQP